MKLNRSVFVSSTFRDLEHHRRAVIEALHDLVWLRVMESRGAAAGKVANNCMKWVRDSDLYLGVFGMCYGSRENHTGKSFTELEYEEAMNRKLPCLIYMIDENRHTILPSNIDKGKDAEDLIKLKSRVVEENHCGYFRSIEHLQYQVIRDLIGLFDDLGWWASNADDSNASGTERESNNGKIQICAWGSHNGFVDLTKVPMDARQKADMAASMLISRFEQGDFAALYGVVTLKYEIRNALRALMPLRDIDEIALTEEISRTTDALYLRILIDIAGLTRSSASVMAICDRVINEGRRWDMSIKEMGYEMRSFMSVAEEALGRMPLTGEGVIAEYALRARLIKKWHEKDAFENALKRIRLQQQNTHQ